MSTRRHEYTERTRRAILRSARRVFSRKGYRATSIGQIAAGARLSPGALYKHFSSKEELFGAVADELQRELFEEVVKASSSYADPLERLRVARRVFVDSCQREDVNQIIWVDYASVLGEEAWRTQRPSYTVEVLKELLGALAEDSRLRLANVDAAAHMIFGAIAEGARWMAGVGTDAARREVDAFLDALEVALIEPGTADQKKGKRPRRS